MKVTQIKVDDSEISSVIDLVSDLQVSDQAKDRIKEEVGQFLVEQTLLSVSKAQSPISGESWKKSLSPEYRKRKEEAGETPIANLEAKGDLMASLGFEKTEDGIKLAIEGTQAPKADGHNNFSGDSALPQRRFLPGEGQEYRREISRGVQEIINDIVAEDTIVVRSDFQGVETSSELYRVLGGILGLSSRASISRAVIGNDHIRKLLLDLDLMDLL